MKRTFNSLLFLLVIAVIFSACGGKYPGYKKTESGLYYKFFTESGDTAKPKENDILNLKLSYSAKIAGKDTLFMDGKNDFKLPLAKSAFKGDIYEGLKLMSKGDSASFIMSADSFYKKIVRGPLPKGVDSLGVLTFNVKLIDFMSQEEMMKKQEAENATKEVAETEVLNKYLTDNKITTAPTASGLYYIEVKKGNGKKPVAGKKVKVHYTGTLLDGTKFDSSFDHDGKQPLEFPLGQGQVIPGWDEGVALMSVGGKAKLIIPSKLAYGARNAGPIPAFSTLLFDVELVEVEK
jgi:FKBP-type peptidyl-prolyl cis-trans isomerase FkpA